MTRGNLPLPVISQVAMLLEEYYNSGDINEAAVSLQVNNCALRLRVKWMGWLLADCGDLNEAVVSLQVIASTEESQWLLAGLRWCAHALECARCAVPFYAAGLQAMPTTMFHRSWTTPSLGTMP